MKTLAFSVICFFWLYGNLSAEDSAVLSVQSQIVPSSSVTVAENAEIIVRIRANQKISISSFSLPSVDDFQIADIETSPSEKEGEDGWETKIKISFLPMTIGETIFPSLSLTVQTEMKQAQVLETPPVKMTVVNPISGQISPEMLRDIKPPVQVGGENWIWVVLVLILTAVLGAWLILRHKKPAPLVSVPPSLPADEVALEKLNSAIVNYRKSGDFKLFYIEISVILREYLGNRFSLDALEKTTTEIFTEMRRIEIDRKICLQSKEILTSCDLVKFAKFVPSDKQIEEDVDRVKLFIVQTKEQRTDAADSSETTMNRPDPEEKEVSV